MHSLSHATLKNRRPRGERGFTLFEIAIVLVIVGLLTAGIAAFVLTFLKSTKARGTSNNAAIVQQALQSFVEHYGRLPCPARPTLAPGATGYGVEDAAGTSVGASCAATTVGATNMARGVVPWISLGLPLEQAQDGYSRMFTYNVSIAGTLTGLSTNCSGSPAATNCTAAAQGNMTVHTATPTALGLPPVGNQINSCWVGAGAPSAGENSCNLNAIVVLVSHGENGFGAYMSSGGQMNPPTLAAELENTNADVAFVQGDPTGAGFDDLVFPWAPGDIVNPLARQNLIRSATAATNDELRDTAAGVANAMVNGLIPPSSYAVPGASPIPLPNDPWGTALVYNSAVSTQQLCLLGPGTVVFTLTSLGVDRVVGLNPSTNRNDDLVISVTVDALKSQINNRAGNSC